MVKDLVEAIFAHLPGWRFARPGEFDEFATLALEIVTMVREDDGSKILVSPQTSVNLEFAVDDPRPFSGLRRSVDLPITHLVFERTDLQDRPAKIEHAARLIALVLVPQCDAYSRAVA